MTTTTRRSALGTTIGLIAGIVATEPVTIVMILWHRRLPAAERYPLPPREVTMKLAREAGISRKMSSEVRSGATLLAHFGDGVYAAGFTEQLATIFLSRQRSDRN